MKNLQEATEKICDLKGSLLALDALVTTLLQQMSPAEHVRLLDPFDRNAEVARTVMLHAEISDHTIAGFDRDVERFIAVLRGCVGIAGASAGEAAPG